MKKIISIICGLYILVAANSYAQQQRCVNNYSCDKVTLSPKTISCSPGLVCGPITITNNYNFALKLKDIVTADGSNTIVQTSNNCNDVVAAYSSCEFTLVLSQSAILGSSLNYVVNVAPTLLQQALIGTINIGPRHLLLTDSDCTTASCNALMSLDNALLTQGSAFNVPYRITFDPTANGDTAYITNIEGGDNSRGYIPIIH